MKRIGRAGRAALATALLALGARPAPASGNAVVAGTVFRDSGFALRGAEVTASPHPPANRKKSAWRATSDARGEFFLRLPPGPASYTVVVRANGYKPVEKQVTFSADERLDLNFLLDPDPGAARSGGAAKQ